MVPGVSRATGPGAHVDGSGAGLAGVRFRATGDLASRCRHSCGTRRRGNRLGGGVPDADSGPDANRRPDAVGYADHHADLDDHVDEKRHGNPERDGDADTDPLIMKLSSTTVADSQNFVIPDQGILFKDGVYIKFGATITSITVLFEGGAAA